jgi:hypothetical protein
MFNLTSLVQKAQSLIDPTQALTGTPPNPLSSAISFGSPIPNLL